MRPGAQASVRSNSHEPATQRQPAAGRVPDRVRKVGGPKGEGRVGSRLIVLLAHRRLSHQQHSEKEQGQTHHGIEDAENTTKHWEPDCNRAASQFFALRFNRLREALDREPRVPRDQFCSKNAHCRTWARS